MKMFIHSVYGVHECEPMTLQAVEKSIPEQTLYESADDTADSLPEDPEE